MYFCYCLPFLPVNFTPSVDTCNSQQTEEVGVECNGYICMNIIQYRNKIDNVELKIIFSLKYYETTNETK